MRIYDGDFTVGRLIEQCGTAPHRASNLPLPGHEPAKEIDLISLNRCLDDLPIAEIRRRRRRMNTFYEEVLVSSDPDHGVQFSSLLMILAHHKVINDNKSLRYVQNCRFLTLQKLTHVQIRRILTTSRATPARRRSCAPQCRCWLLRYIVLVSPIPPCRESQETRSYGYYSSIHRPRDLHRRRRHHEHEAYSTSLSKCQLAVHARRHKYTRWFGSRSDATTPRHQYRPKEPSQLDTANTYCFTNSYIAWA